MQIFISWSGEASKECAEALRSWLPLTNQAISPFVSSQDISKGERGLAAIANQLQECSFGIVCVTRENQSAPWINFEAGALSRELGESSLIPFLLDMPIKDLSGPLSQFQATDSMDESDVWSMVKSINDKCKNPVDQDRLRKTFDAFREELAQNLHTIRSKRAEERVPPERDTPDILNELVGLVREQSNRIGTLQSLVRETQGSVSHYTINEPHEVKISAEHLSEKEERQRLVTTSMMLRRIIGAEKIIDMSRSRYGLKVKCDADQLPHVQALHSKIQDCAARNGIAVDVYCGSECIVFPPF
ncbi:toll/interleukin-1 receptor domain-containing protein [Streptomyces sp. NPDC006516]|uniref:toll/interleukin-1 receptor domain-containing protein n=1 Tax=Streptomyces sp. NPDC006516 TaxID=3154309 RepID=UPI0033B964C2